MKTQLERLNKQIDGIEAAIKVTSGLRRAGLQARRTGLIEKRRKLLLKQQPAVGTKRKVLLVVALIFLGFGAYYWYATSPGRCGWDRTRTGLPCPRSAPPGRLCSVHEPIIKARIAELQRVLKERSK